MFNWSGSPTVTHCTFSGNEADDDSGGGMFNENSSPTVTNCIFWGNTDTADGIYGPIIDEDAQIAGGTPVVVNYCCVQGLTGLLGGVGNTGDDPLFVDEANVDLHLSAGSPCIDAGDPGGDYTGQTDIDGEPRLMGPRVDMGAYEYPYYALTLRIMPSPHFPWGTVDVEPNLPEYLSGTVVTLTAEAHEDRSFGFWTIRHAHHPGNPHDSTIDANNPITVVMDADREVTAVFKRRECGDGIPPFLPMMLGVLGLFGLMRRRG